MAEISPKVEPLTLFNPDEFVGRMFTGLPEFVENRAYVAGYAALFSKPRYSQTLGRYDDDEEIIFHPEENIWVHWKGAMCASATASDIAMTGVRKYMADILGVKYFRFTDELTGITDRVAEEYDRRYPVKQTSKVMLEPGW